MTPIDPERWRRIKPILDAAWSLPSVERARWLDEACAGDPGLRTAVERLLRADVEGGGLLDTPSDDVLRALMRDAEDETRPADDASAAAGPARQEFLPGTILSGRYRIVSLLGRGGMGEVYRADDLRLGQAVALKFVSEERQRNPEYLRRLMMEARLARQVSHHNVCRVFDVGDADGRQFLSMEYVDGEDLASLLKRIGHLPQAKALDVARQLCAGLDAAHRQGILHRDLKPANVILDGRGQVRITDFGLAVATEQLEGPEVRFGTPAYMSPEQLAGREVTVRSDVYSLGLLLYELFTGRRAFQTFETPADGPSRHDSSPPPPTQVIDGLHPAIDRTILSCLEDDPTLRPVSARAVAADLPGGDPIAAALAAGVTPSPDAVAASGPEGALRPATAFGLLGVTLVGLVFLVLLSDRASILGWLPITRSPDVLEDNARGILQRLGHDPSPVDRTSHLILGNQAYESFVSAHDKSPDRWTNLSQPGQVAYFFFYRQASRSLRPLGWTGQVDASDPSLAAGDVVMTTDLRGRLIWLQAQPPEAHPAGEASIPFDWSRLFVEAGLDVSRFEPVPPTRNPPMTTDARAAWRGVLADFGDCPVRIEAAALKGTPVFFELVVPWDSYWDPSAAPRVLHPTGTAPVWYLLLIIFALGTGTVLVARNWLSARGDRRGAFRVALVTFCVRLAIWLLGGHHVPAFLDEVRLLATALGASLMDAAAVWCLYIALEPHARKVFPRLLVSWTRALRGRAQDPLVGRDILCGAVLSIVVIAAWGQLYALIPHALQLTDSPPPVPHPIGALPYAFFAHPPPTRAILGGRYVLAALVSEFLTAFGYVFLMSVVLLGLRLALRREWAAALAFLGSITLLGWPSDFSQLHPIGMACTFAGGVIMLWAFRLGFVVVLVLWFCVGTWLNFPVTATPGAPHFGIGLVGVLVIAALAAYGAVIAARPHLGGRPDFSRSSSPS